MKKLFKVLGIAVLVVLALLVTLPLLVESRIDGIVRREAEKRLAARLDFERLDLSLLRHFPRASVDLKGLTLVGEGEFAGDTIVAARRISVVVNLGSLLGGRIGVLFAKPQIDRRLVIACLYQVLLREGSFSPLALRTLSAFPREMLCAMTLQSIL